MVDPEGKWSLWKGFPPDSHPEKKQLPGQLHTGRKFKVQVLRPWVRKSHSGSHVTKTLVSYPSGRLVVHISTLLVVTLAVLAARHLPFAASALLVAAATFAHTLERRGEVRVMR